MSQRIALTRAVSPGMARCELTYLERAPIDIGLAQAQHEAYEQALASLGCRLIRLPAEPDLPDSVFVEDAAVVLDELAVITRPGAASRRPETESIARALAPYRELVTISPPGAVDGGDVLRVGKTLYVGESGRSNAGAVRQMRDALAPFGYRVLGAPVRGCLHLKSAVTQAAPDALLVNRAWMDPTLFPGMRLIEVDPSEPHAANGLLIGQALVFPSSYPRTRERLEREGIDVRPVDMTELIKAEGAVTCCSLIFDA